MPRVTVIDPITAGSCAPAFEPLRDLLAHIMTLDGRFFQANPPGAMIERIQGDTIAVQGVWANLITSATRDVISLVMLFAVAVSIDPQWTLAALIGAPILIAPAALVQRYIRRKVRQNRADASARAVWDFCEARPWVANLAEDPATRSNTSVCLRLTDGRIRDGAAFAKAVAKRLEAENAAWDVGAYRDAPPGLRVWCGGTVELADVQAMLPWLDWAFHAEVEVA